MDQAQQAVATYKQLAFAVYGDSVTEATKLREAIEAFTASPDDGKLATARTAWEAARVPYNQNDAFRFYNGPIDHDPDGPEGLLNGWPLDENFIDSTRDEPSAGIINSPEKYPTIDSATLAGLNESGGEKNLSVGYHAIEFLLWGQDDLEPGKGAGKRPASDFVDGSEAKNQGRRRDYLKATASLLVDDLTKVKDQWEPGKADSFAATFGQKPQEGSVTNDGLKDAIASILRGMGSLAKAELAGERMTVAYKNRGQEDEHSCFSDYTWHDLHGNALGIQNVWLGQYKGQKLGAGLDPVIRAVDAALADQITADLNTAVSTLDALASKNATAPFDVVIAEPDGSANRNAMVTVIKALRSVGDGLSTGATKLGLSIELEKPSEEL